MLTRLPALLRLLLPQGMGMSPEMMSMMNQMDFSQEKVQQQFSELGLKPEDVIQKVSHSSSLACKGWASLHALLLECGCF
jgi:hypothetical protein